MPRFLPALLLITSFLPLLTFPTAADELPPYKRLLSGEDGRKAVEMHNQVGDLDDADKYAEAITLAQELLALRTRLQGKDHYETVNVRWLFLAGARSILLSQWQVSDAATSLLMVRFYENWLGTRNGKSMSKAEALKEAKSWLRNLTRDEVEQLLANLPEGSRGLKLEHDTTTPETADRPFAHPYYWSAFILIGDPS